MTAKPPELPDFTHKGFTCVAADESLLKWHITADDESRARYLQTTGMEWFDHVTEDSKPAIVAKIDWIWSPKP